MELGKLNRKNHCKYVEQQNDSSLHLGDKDEIARKKAEHIKSTKYTSNYSDDLILTYEH